MMWKNKAIILSAFIIFLWATLFLVNDQGFNTALRYGNAANSFGYAIGYLGGSVLAFFSFVYIGAAVLSFWVKRIRQAWFGAASDK